MIDTYYNHEMNRFFEILAIKPLGRGRYIIESREKPEDYENQLALEGYTLLGFIDSSRNMNYKINAFYLAHGKHTPYYQLYKGRWIDNPDSPGRQMVVLFKAGRMEPTSEQHYKKWRELRSFHERALLPRCEKHPVKLTSTQLIAEVT
jgi:hypothetical protein